MTEAQTLDHVHVQLQLSYRVDFRATRCVSLGRHETMVKVAEAWSVQRLIEGESLGDTLSRLFNNTPLKPLLDRLVMTNAAADP